jgi:hypothetical protein
MRSYVTAFEHFNEHRNTLKMTTGSPNLDSLIDRCTGGTFWPQECFACDTLCSVQPNDWLN